MVDKFHSPVEYAQGRHFFLRYILSKQTLMIAGVMLLILLCAASLVLSSPALSFEDSLEVIRDLISGHAPDKSSFLIMMELRAPRTLAAALCGSSLASSGVLLQAALDNNLAAPGVMGINSASGFFALVAALLFPGLVFARQLFAFMGALCVVFFIWLISKKAGVNRTTLILSGVALSSLMGACSDAIVSFYPESVSDKVAFSLGGFSAVTFPEVLRVLPLIVIGIVFACLLSRGIDLFALGDESAQGLGLNVSRRRLESVVLAALLAASAVSICGLLGFVGLIIPNIIRLLEKNMTQDIHTSQTRTALLLASVWGAVFLLLCDMCARSLFYPYELPAGLLLSCIGAPFFIVLLIFRKKFSRRYAVYDTGEGVRT